MPKISSTNPTADQIAEMATRGEDISAYFTNKFTVVRPVRRVNVPCPVFAQPLLGFLNRALFLLADLFPVQHGFQQTGDSGELRGRQTVN